MQAFDQNQIAITKLYGQGLEKRRIRGSLHQNFKRKSVIKHFRQTSVQTQCYVACLLGLDDHCGLAQQRERIDPEDNILTEVNFEYYTSHKFHSSQAIKEITERNYFSVFHSNVRSIAANYDNLTALLTELNHNFQLIGVLKLKTTSIKIV